MGKEARLDIGFFEPFRNNIIEWTSDGYFKVRLMNLINFDKSIIETFFNDFTIEMDRENRFDPFTVTFSGWAKTEEIKGILMSMAFTHTIIINGWPDEIQ